MIIQLFLYVTFLSLGYIAPRTEPVVLISMGILLMGVIFASLIIPFGGLDKKTECFSIVLLKNGPISFIGWHIGNTAAFIGHTFDVAITGSIIFVATLLLSYWRTSYHSREYRFNNFLPISQGLPITSMVICSLRIRRYSSLADEIIIAIAEKEPLPKELLEKVGISSGVVTQMEEELAK